MDIKDVGANLPHKRSESVGIVVAVAIHVAWAFDGQLDYGERLRRKAVVAASLRPGSGNDQGHVESEPRQRTLTLTVRGVASGVVDAEHPHA